MAERSLWWTTNGTGHGVGSGYAGDRYQAMYRKLYVSDQASIACVLNGVDNELAVSGTASPLSVATGAAIDHSFFYENDTAKSLTVTTPVVGLTGGHVILEANWAAQTVTALAVRNTDGVSGIPALTQVANTTWQVRLATFTIATNGTITLTDVRRRAKYSNHVYAGGFDVTAVDGTTIELGSGALRVKDKGISDAKLRDSAALSVIGRGANTLGAPADIAAGTDGFVLRRSGTTLAFGQVATAGIADNAIDTSKAGNGILMFTHRKGSNAGDWSLAGDNDYTITTIRACAGASTSVTAGSGVKTINFPFTFGNKPLVIANVCNLYGTVNILSRSTTQFAFTVLDADNLPAIADINWIAFGLE